MRGEALNPRLLVVYLEFGYRSVQEPERGGFAVKPTAKYVDECLDWFMSTTRNSANLHDATTVCDQAEHALFRAVVGQLQYIIGVRLDLLFVTMSCKLASPTLGDLTRAKEALRYLKGNKTFESLLHDSCNETQRFE